MREPVLSLQSPQPPRRRRDRGRALRERSPSATSPLLPLPSGCRRGQELTWVNEDDAPHTVLGSDPGSPLKSAALDTGDKYSVTLTRPGAYKYFCSLHPHMTGVVTVSG